MKYWMDCEFIEGFNRPFFGRIFGKRRHFIDLISIGITSEDGRNYYAISSEFNPKDADDWVHENVLAKIAQDYIRDNEDIDVEFTRMDLDTQIGFIQADIGKSHKEIKQDILSFTNCVRIAETREEKYFCRDTDIQFIAYYADYDWVLFCSLFGRMIDLPKNYPFYCYDLKQLMHEKKLGSVFLEANCPPPTEEHHALADAIWNKKLHQTIEEHVPF